MAKPARAISRETLEDCLRDPVTFSSVILGFEPWPHQAELLRCESRTVVVKAGRRSGKSTAAAVKGLHKAFRKPGTGVLIISAGEDAAKRVLEEAQRLAATSHLFADFVEDSLKTEMSFGNGSKIVSVPKSEARIRGMGADLLILDEAFQMPDSLWQAAEPVTAANPGAQIWICSTPGNSPLHFWNRRWRQGKDSPSEWVRSFHWPSSVSPLISKRVLDQIEAENDPWYFRREYLAEDTDDAEAVFPDSLIFGSVAEGVTPLSPEAAHRMREPVERWGEGTIISSVHSVSAGVDVGGSRDPHAICCVGPVDDLGANARRVYAVMHLEILHQEPIEVLTERVLEIGDSYLTNMVVPESSGLGFHFAHGLPRRYLERGLAGIVVPVPTSSESKTLSIGQAAGMMGDGELVIPGQLPNFDILVSQLRAMGRETLPSGAIRLAARQGHDDAVLALSLALRGIHPHQGPRPSDEIHTMYMPEYPFVTTDLGIKVPLDCRPEKERFSGWRHPAHLTR